LRRQQPLFLLTDWIPAVVNLFGLATAEL